jgi:hypothetical protein
MMAWSTGATVVFDQKPWNRRDHNPFQKRLDRKLFQKKFDQKQRNVRI